RILLSIDNVPVGEHQATGAYRRGEGGRDICWDNIAVTAGRHTMTVHVDSANEVPETNDTNNLRAIAFFVAPTPRVDLRLTSLLVTPTEGGVGMNQLFIVNVTNIGDARAPTSRLSLEDDNGVLANWSVPELAPRQSWTMVHASRPEYRPVGTFVARAVIDPANEIAEISEDNNEALFEYTVLDHPAPDYTITNVTVSGNRTEMRGLRIDATVANVGDRLVRGTGVRILNETNATLAESTTVSLIYPNQTATLQFFLALRAGTHELRLVVDPMNRIVERNEKNNEWNLTLVIDEPTVALDLPNLVIERVYAMPGDPRPGEVVSVGALIHNIGTNRSNATTVNFLVNDELIGTAAVPALKPDAYYSAYVPWRTATSATFVITAVVDQRNALLELDESDNALDLQILITTQRAPSEEPPEAPPATTPPPATPTAPATPTPATPTAPTRPPTTDTASRVVVGELIVTTRPTATGASGVISVSLRNPNIERVGLLTVQFKANDKILKEVLVQGIPGAGTIAATSGEVELPPGKNAVSVEVRVVGAVGPAVVRQGEYEQESGKKQGLPGFEAAALLVALLGALALRRRR
ncbi:MAG TPA: CARDB domain-containing protein, partial [Candidatus Thermoplasmatota archaeon]|nr:CARDB domain-containing protein [Candidatus Thermoplasmatota archaeon]